MLLSGRHVKFTIVISHHYCTYNSLLQPCSSFILTTSKYKGVLSEIFDIKRARISERILQAFDGGGCLKNVISCRS